MDFAAGSSGAAIAHAVRRAHAELTRRGFGTELAPGRPCAAGCRKASPAPRKTSPRNPAASLGNRRRGRWHARKTSLERARGRVFRGAALGTRPASTVGMTSDAKTLRLLNAVEIHTARGEWSKAIECAVELRFAHLVSKDAYEALIDHVHAAKAERCAARRH